MRPLSPRAAAALLVVVTVVAYLPALRAGYIWDDDQYLTSNALLSSWGGLLRIWSEPRATPQYYPLVFTTFWLEHRIWGLWPAGYHLTNVLLHAAAAVMVLRILRALAAPGAIVAALLFALHPVHVESVAWVTERKNVLSGVLYLVSLLFALRGLALDAEEAPRDERARRRSWHVALAAFVAALLSKTVTCSLPVALIVICWWKRRRLARADILRLAGFAVVGAAFGLHTAWLERHHVGAWGAEWTLSPVERWLVAGRAFWFYLRKLCWPANLAFIYPRWSLDASDPAQHLYPVLAIAFLTALWMLRDRIGRGPAAALAFFGLTLAPALGFVDVYPMRFSFVADHFQYLASLGPLALIAAMLAGAARRAPPSLAVAAVLLLAATLSARVWAQARIYRDPESLWTDTLRRNPRAWIALNNLGGWLLREGRTEEAAARLSEAVRIKPDYAEASNNLGLALFRLGRLDEAASAYEAALRFEPRQAASHYNLGNTRAVQGRLAEAAEHFRAAVTLDPSDAIAWRDLGRALALQGRMEEAVEPLRTAVRARPDDAETARELAYVVAATARAR